MDFEKLMIKSEKLPNDVQLVKLEGNFGIIGDDTLAYIKLPDFQQMLCLGWTFGCSNLDSSQTIVTFGLEGYSVIPSSSAQYSSINSEKYFVFDEVNALNQDADGEGYVIYIYGYLFDARKLL